MSYNGPMNRDHLGVFCFVSVIYLKDFQAAMECGGFGAFMALMLGFGGLPTKVDKPPSPQEFSNKRGLERKLEFLRRNWKKSPGGLVLWMLMVTFFGASLLGGLLISLLNWALGVPDPFGQPIFKVPGSGPYDMLLFILPGLLFTWIIFIPVFDWMDRLEVPKLED